MVPNQTITLVPNQTIIPTAQVQEGCAVKEVFHLGRAYVDGVRAESDRVASILARDQHREVVEGDEFNCLEELLFHVVVAREDHRRLSSLNGVGDREIDKHFVSEVAAQWHLAQKEAPLTKIALNLRLDGSARLSIGLDAVLTGVASQCPVENESPSGQQVQVVEERILAQAAGRWLWIGDQGRVACSDGFSQRMFRNRCEVFCKFADNLFDQEESPWRAEELVPQFVVNLSGEHARVKKERVVGCLGEKSRKVPVCFRHAWPVPEAQAWHK